MWSSPAPTSCSRTARPQRRQHAGRHHHAASCNPLAEAPERAPDHPHRALDRSYGTEPISPAFVGLCHPDLEGDIRNLPGFVPAEKYGSISPWEKELGKCEDVRYLTSTIFDPWADAGGAKAGASGTCLSTTGTSADVYPLLYVGSDAYGIVALKGAYAITPTVVNPKPSDSDPLGQRGHAGWKSMQTAVILNDLWMVRAEVAALA